MAAAAAQGEGAATLGQAIANASEGDTIAMGPGSYAGTVVSKAVSLTFSAGAAVIASAVPVADGATAGRNASTVVRG